MAKKKYYAISTVDDELLNLILEDWNACKALVNGHKSIYKSFLSKEEADEFLKKLTPKAKEESKKSSSKSDNKTSKKGKNAQDNFNEIINPANNGNKSAMSETVDEVRYDIACLNEDQKKAFDLLVSGENVFLSGQAGTGKSYVLNCFLQFIENSKNVIVTAPSGIAAINVGGATLHSTFQVPYHPILPTDKIKVPKLLNEADVIVIDEISMCRCDIFDYVGRVIQKTMAKNKKNIQLIVVGDFFQLPPVITKNDRHIKDDKDEEVDFFEKYYESQSGFAYDSKMWDFFDFKSYVLTKVIRQTDQDFIKYLNMVREGNVEGLFWINEHSVQRNVPGIYLCPRNAEALRVNMNALDSIPGPVHTFKASITGNVKSSDKANDDEVDLKEGAEVVFLINDSNHRYQNGSFGRIEEINGDKIRVRLRDDSYVTVEPYTWTIEEYRLSTQAKGKIVLDKEVVGQYTQIPLKLAYATTIHKSQGQTYDAVNIDPACFAHGQLYVALSRVKSIEGLHLVKKMTPRELVVDQSVNEFYSKVTNAPISSGFTKEDIKYVDVKVPEVLLDSVKKLIEKYEKMYE